MAWEDEVVGPDVASAGLHISERIGRDVAAHFDLEEALEASRYASHPYSSHPKEVRILIPSLSRVRRIDVLGTEVQNCWGLPGAGVGLRRLRCSFLGLFVFPLFSMTVASAVRSGGQSRVASCSHREV